MADTDDALRAENAELHQQIRTLTVRLGELERLADTDTLTPLLNRRAFLREIERSVARVVRYGMPVAVMIADLDGLKAINDGDGHQAGDAALMYIGYMLKAQLRAVDTVARIGGDEFGIILEGVDDVAAASKAASLSAQIAAQPVDGQRVTVSIGYTLVRTDDTIDTIIARADAAMYARKRAQRSDR